MEDLTTVDSIIEWFSDLVSKKIPIDPETWLEGAARLNVLLQGEQEKQFDMEQEVAKLRNVLLDSGESVAKARSKIEATEEYKTARKQKARVDRVNEQIRIAKIQGRMASDVLRAN
jgi:hypothetical protein